MGVLTMTNVKTALCGGDAAGAAIAMHSEEAARLPPSVHSSPPCAPGRVSQVQTLPSSHLPQPVLPVPSDTQEEPVVLGMQRSFPQQILLLCMPAFVQVLCQALGTVSVELLSTTVPPYRWGHTPRPPVDA